MIDLEIKDVTVQMELNGVFWNEDGIVEMMVTTKAEHSLILRLVVDLESKTIRAMNAEIVVGSVLYVNRKGTNVVNLMTCKIKWIF